MSDFQIPGLGQAKPNEVLPPLPPDIAIAVPGARSDDAKPPATVTSPEAQRTEAPDTAVKEQTATIAEPDAMAIDRPGSPPSLTHALEAALGELDTPSTEQPPENPPPMELQNDTSANPEWEVDSSPYVSSSESSSSDSSSDEDSDNEGYELLGVEETARLLMQAEGGSDDEGEKGGKSSNAAQVRTKNEVVEEIIPRPDVKITAEMKIEELGAIEHIVENIALVKAITPGEYQVLDAGSVLCTADRVVIGAVAETIGKIIQPMYTVRFTSDDEIKDIGLEVGMKVFYPVDHASYVFTEPLKNMKGSDASNLHDEEVGDEEMEFSDDEKEAEYKRSLKQKKREKWKSGERKGGKEPHPLRNEVRSDGGLKYDDDEDEDGPYKPLARPAGYGEGPVSQESYEPAPGRNFSRGRRGDRGRGGRGRGSGRGGRGGYNPPRDGYSLPPQGGQQPAAPQAQWGQPPAAPQSPAPAMPTFGFQMPGWPQPPAQATAAPAVPPPPPGWPAAQGQGQPANGGAFVNPAFFAALMSHMQAQAQAQNGQQQWPQQPPSGRQG